MAFPKKKATVTPVRTQSGQFLHKYNLNFPYQLADWQLELLCWADRINTGYDPFYHMRNAFKAMWPENVWHPWTETRFGAMCEPEYEVRIGKTVIRVFTWVGCGAAGKTRDSGMLALGWWLAHPSLSIVMLTSTTKDSIRQRVWPVIQSLYYDFQERHMVPARIIGPNLVNSQTMLEMEKGEGKHAIYAQAVKDGETAKAIENIKGRHAERMMLVVDEAAGTPEAIFEAIPNIFKGATEVNLLFLSNAPVSKLNPFSRLCEPVEGWQSVGPDSLQWPTRPLSEWQVPRGTCLHFSGKFSPNVVAQKTIFPFLYSYENWKRVEGNPEITRTPQFWSQDLGFWPPEGALFTVVTESLVQAHDATGRHIFNTWKTPIAALDPSFGNDECKLVFGAIGDLPNGKTGIQVAETMTIQIAVDARDEDGKPVPPEYQIAHAVIAECEARGVKPTHLGVEAGGNPGVIGVLLKEWGDVIRVESGGNASDLPASVEDPRPSNEVYDRKITEIYATVRAFIESDLLKGLYPAAVSQLCARLWDVERRHKRKSVEKKEDFKSRFGRSPDDADAIGVLCQVAREHGADPVGLIGPRSGEPQETEISEDIFDEDTRQNDTFLSFMVDA